MRGIIFSLDMAFAAVAVIVFLTLVGFVLQQSPQNDSTSQILSLHAKDAAVLWQYGGQSSSTFPAGTESQCTYSFRPDTSLDILDPLVAADWNYSLHCGVVP